MTDYHRPPRPVLYYFISVLSAFLPAALLVGLAWAPRRDPATARLGWTLLLSILIGAVAGRLLPAMTVTLLWGSLLQIALTLLVLIAQIPLPSVPSGLSNRKFQLSPILGYACTALLAATAAFRLGQDPNLGALTATAVVNTDLLLNLTALLLGLALTVTLGVLLGSIVRALTALRWPLLIANTLLILVPLTGSLVLALIRLKHIGLTRENLSFVARTTNYPWLLTHLALATLLIAALARLLRLPPTTSNQQPATNNQQLTVLRKTLAARRTARRIAIGLLALSATAGAAQLYWDQVASRPLQRGDAHRIEAGADGNVRLPLDLVADNQLHRYEWIADDGKIVRFFIINRHPGAISPAVVFDACALCGDMGYVHRDDRVICIACGVNLVLPSVGKPGGCNPVIMENWRQTDTEILIPRDSLAAGAQMFTTSIEPTAAAGTPENPICGAPSAPGPSSPACCPPNPAPPGNPKPSENPKS